MARQARLILLRGIVALVALHSPAWAQRRPRPLPPLTPPAAPAPPPTPEYIAVPVHDVDGMLRRMRVWLLTPPPGCTAFGNAPNAPGHHIWALLPSCRPPDPNDSREQCPVDRVVFEAIAGSGVTVGDPQAISSAPDARRVQTIVVGPAATRLRIKLMNMRGQSRYEAVIEAARLDDLPAPTGEASAGTFVFDLTQYPSR